MLSYRYIVIIALNLLGLLLLLSWWQPYWPLWPTLDEKIYFYFNQLLIPQHPLWIKFVAYFNIRAFDFISFTIMLLILVLAMFRDQRQLRLLHWFAIGITMLIYAGLIAALNNHLPYQHVSPTLYYLQQQIPIHRISEMVPFKTKDSSGRSFPGDHAMMLFVFMAFVWCYGDRLTVVLSTLLAIFFSLPRIFSGAHWFEDVFMASIAISLLYLPWILLTPLSDQTIAYIEKILGHFNFWQFDFAKLKQHR